MPVDLGPLQPFLEDNEVHEIMVVAGKQIWIEDTTGMHQVGALTTSEVALCTERIARASGRRIDLLSPIIDARLTDGSRACVVIAPIAIDGTTISIRKFPRRVLPLAAFGPSQATDIVRQLISQQCNVVVSGATSSGKTSLISAISNSIPTHQRVVCVEDTAELRFSHPHVVRLQTRPANAESHGEVTLQQLVRASLRLRPDRLIVGEVRGAEAIDMLLALSSGHRGCWATVHALSASDTFNRLSSIILRDSPQWSFEQALQLIHSAIDAVIYIERTPQRKRVISEILQMRDGSLHTLYTRHQRV